MSVLDDLTTLVTACPLTFGVAAQDRLLAFDSHGAECPFEDAVADGAIRVFDFGEIEDMGGTINAGVATVSEPLNVGEYSIRRGYGLGDHVDQKQLREVMRSDDRDLQEYLRDPSNWASVTLIDQLIVGETRARTRAIRREGGVAGYTQITTIRVWSYDH